MNNEQFLDVLTKSFRIYLQTDARSNKKLKVLHPAIANAILKQLNKLSSDNYSVASLDSNGGKEAKIDGRYHGKKVDIVILNNGNPVAGVAIKFVMRNYSQNSNNYFETMLGETVNIRTNKIPYFQIVIFFEETPYFNKEKKIIKWQKITENNIHKYITLSKDEPKAYFHTPDKTLLYLVKLPHYPAYEDDMYILDFETYKNYYKDKRIEISNNAKDYIFEEGIIINDLEKFVKKITHLILGQ
jgi:hypothetical protein